MICRLSLNILHRIGKYILTTSSDSSKSWFFHIRHLSQKYGFPHPLLLLQKPPTKSVFKNLIKSKVYDFWETKLCLSSLSLSSLKYFHPNFMSLSFTHPLWTTCEGNSFEISKAIIQGKLLSGRYRTDKLLGHFSNNNTGVCSMCDLGCEGSIEHLLVFCPSLTQCRQNSFKMLEQSDYFSDTSRTIIFDAYSKPVTNFVQLLLDCSVLPEVISTCQTSNKQVLHEIFKFTRTWCFLMYMQGE